MSEAFTYGFTFIKEHSELCKGAFSVFYLDEVHNSVVDQVHNDNNYFSSSLASPPDKNFPKN